MKKKKKDRKEKTRMKKKKKDRKAWIRIVEAFLACVIIIGAVLIIMARQEPQIDISGTIYEKQNQILNIITENETLRAEILQDQNTNVNNAISKMVPASWEFSTNICDIGKVCPNPENVFERDVYTTEAIVISNLTYKPEIPRKLRFFVWMK